MEWILVIVGLFALFGIISWIRDTFTDAKLYRTLKPRLDAFDSEKEKFANEKKSTYDALNGEKEKFAKEKKETYDHIEKITRQRSMGFPWLAEAYADYFALRDGKLANYLMHKKHPAQTAAEAVQEIKKEKRELVKHNKIIVYKLHYLEKLFPWISELIAENEDEEIPVRMDGEAEEGENEDRVKDYLTTEEYRSLPSVERNQRALDRYLKNRSKSKWAIGRDYEMYVGHLFSQKGYKIHYKGIIDGFEDLGRDIIATKGDEFVLSNASTGRNTKRYTKNIFSSCSVPRWNIGLNILAAHVSKRVLRHFQRSLMIST